MTSFFCSYHSLIIFSKRCEKRCVFSSAASPIPRCRSYSNINSLLQISLLLGTPQRHECYRENTGPKPIFKAAPPNHRSVYSSNYPPTVDTASVLYRTNCYPASTSPRDKLESRSTSCVTTPAICPDVFSPLQSFSSRVNMPTGPSRISLRSFAKVDSSCNVMSMSLMSH
jgi:hypothetical protein